MGYRHDSNHETKYVHRVKLVNEDFQGLGVQHGCEHVFLPSDNHVNVKLVWNCCFSSRRSIYSYCAPSITSPPSVKNMGCLMFACYFSSGVGIFFSMHSYFLQHLALIRLWYSLSLSVFFLLCTTRCQHETRRSHVLLTIAGVNREGGGETTVVEAVLDLESFGCWENPAVWSVSEYSMGPTPT